MMLDSVRSDEGDAKVGDNQNEEQAYLLTSQWRSIGEF
jgi:hypothetical protein